MFALLKNAVRQKSHRSQILSMQFSAMLAHAYEIGIMARSEENCELTNLMARQIYDTLDIGRRHIRYINFEKISLPKSVFYNSNTPWPGNVAQLEQFTDKYLTSADCLCDSVIDNEIKTLPSELKEENAYIA